MPCRQASQGAARWACRVLVVLALVAPSGCVDREQAVQRHLDKARAYAQAGDLGKARVEARNVIKLDPTRVEPYLLLGTVAERNESWRNAWRQYERALQADRQSVEARAAQAQLLMRFGQRERAQELVDEALAIDGDDATVNALQAWLTFGRGEVPTAREQVQRALALNPDLPLALSLSAELEIRAGYVDEGLAVLEEAVARNPGNDEILRLLVRALAGQERFEQAIARQRRVVEMVPDRSDYRITLAALHASAGDAAQAAAVLRDTFRTFQTDSTAQALAGLVVSRFPRDRVVQALRDLIDSYPDTYAFSSVLAGFFERMERWDEAETVLEAYIARREGTPEALDAMVQLARLHTLVDRADEAAALLSQVLESNPRDVDALILRAHLRFQEGKPALAVPDLRLALDAGEKVLPIKRLLAQAHAAAGEPALALEVLQEALELAPDDEALRLALAGLALREGRLALARDQLDAAVELGADSPQVLELRFHLAERSGEHARAAQMAATLRERLPEEAIGYYLEGRIAHLQQRFEAAREAYLAALERQPGASEVIDALVRVQVAMGEEEAAMALLDDRLAAQPDDVAANLLRADVLSWRSGEASDEVLNSFRRLIEVQPQWWLPHARLAAALARQGDEAGARAALERGLEATGDHPMLGQQLAAMALAAGNVDAAIDVYEDLHAAHPQVDRIANNLAMLLASRPADQPGLARAMELTEPFLASSDPALLDTAGWVRLMGGELEVATELLRRAVRVAPERPTLHYHLAVAYLRLGDERAAARELDVALASTLAFPERDKAVRTRAQLAEAPDAATSR